MRRHDIPCHPKLIQINAFCQDSLSNPLPPQHSLTIISKVTCLLGREQWGKSFPLTLWVTIVYFLFGLFTHAIWPHVEGEMTQKRVSRLPRFTRMEDPCHFYIILKSLREGIPGFAYPINPHGPLDTGMGTAGLISRFHNKSGNPRVPPPDILPTPTENWVEQSPVYQTESGNEPKTRQTGERSCCGEMEWGTEL